jgi:two-component system, OmpR family, phosphate regulon sensor histidine kinase PhoR
MGDFYGAAPKGDGAVAMGLAQFIAVSSIFDAEEMVLYVADMDTHELLFCNSHAERLWGADWAGRRCHAVLQGDAAGPCSFCTNHRLIQDGRAGPPVTWEFQNTVNKRWYLCIDKAIPWSDGRLVRMEVAIDITERKAQEQFREQYIGLISHDLRTPLATIALSASALQLLLEKRGLAEGARPVDAILRNTRRMAEMIEDLLETTRLESGRMKLHKSYFDLSDIVGAVITQLGMQASHPICWEASGPAPVLADAGRIERVLENLLGNAVRYSAPDMPVTVRIQRNGTESMVTVADRGAGIAADELPKLFQRFYRASSSRSIEGLGLGLYNSRLIVESHGGRIWAESELGAGSTFGFALPAGPFGSPAR